MDMEPMTIIVSNFSSEASARSVSRILMQERIITSANIFAPQFSLYPWEGDVRAQSETAVYFKTAISNKPRLLKRLSELHPYDLPSLISLGTSANADYIEWLEDPRGFVSSPEKDE